MFCLNAIFDHDSLVEIINAFDFKTDKAKSDGDTVKVLRPFLEQLTLFYTTAWRIRQVIPEVHPKRKNPQIDEF